MLDPTVRQNLNRQTERTTSMIYQAKDLEAHFQEMTRRAEAHCVLLTELVGGQSADRDGVAAFVEHHLKLVGKEADDAVIRIMKEEIGERETTPEGGEVDEKLTYGLSVVRRDLAGPWLGDWMVKACLKAAASRLGLFMSKKGCKGDMAEMGRVRAIGASMATPSNPERIHFIGEDGASPAPTFYQTFKGRVSTPMGAKSIVSDKECVAAGSRFSFEFRCYDGKLKADDIAKIFAAAMNIGLGSAKAFERGKFRVDTLVID
jgi:hypothetical protein